MTDPRTVYCVFLALADAGASVREAVEDTARRFGLTCRQVRAIVDQGDRERWLADA